MLIPEAGVHQISERYFFTPSSLARELFYYPTRCGHYYCNHTYSFSHQSEIAQQGDHNRNIMLFTVQDGALELEIAGEKTLAARGQAVIFDCREPYRYSASDGLEFYWMLFEGLNSREFYRRIVRAHSGRHVFAPSAYPELVSQMETLTRTCAEGERLSEAEISQLLHRTLCLLLLGNSAGGSTDKSVLSQAIRYMNQHLFEPITVQDVAASIQLSPSHFSRQFKSETGYSPYEYIVLRRIDRAKHMLTSTQMSIKEIAYHTGYNSEENFIHSFRKNVGISPGLFRKYPI